MRWIERLKEKIYGIPGPKTVAASSSVPSATVSCGMPERVLLSVAAISVVRRMVR